MRQGARRRRPGARRRPTRAEIEPAALALLQRHGSAIMATARRFAASPEDAEDAYQRGVAAILTHIGQGPEFCAGHKEYALPPGRKSLKNRIKALSTRERLSNVQE